MNALVFFWLLFKASLFSTTGSGNLPILHQDLLARGWAADRQFAEALAIGQVSPGPTGLWVISLGYLVDGLRGAALALIAVVVPPLLVLAIAAFYRRASDHPAMRGFVRGLSLAVAGIFLTVLFGIMRTAGFEPRSFILAAGALAIGTTRRVPVIGVVLLAALAGIALYR